MLSGSVVSLRRSCVRFTRIGHCDGATEAVLRNIRGMFGTGRMHMSTHTRQSYYVRSPRRGLDQRRQVAFGFRLCEFLNRLTGRDHQHHGPSGPILLNGERRGDGDDGQQIDADVTMPHIVDHAKHGDDNRV